MVSQKTASSWRPGFLCRPDYFAPERSKILLKELSYPPLTESALVCAGWARDSAGAECGAAAAQPGRKPVPGHAPQQRFGSPAVSGYQGLPPAAIVPLSDTRQEPQGMRHAPSPPGPSSGLSCLGGMDLSSQVWGRVGEEWSRFAPLGWEGKREAWGFLQLAVRFLHRIVRVCIYGKLSRGYTLLSTVNIRDRIFQLLDSTDLSKREQWLSTDKIGSERNGYLKVDHQVAIVWWWGKRPFQAAGTESAAAVTAPKMSQLGPASTQASWTPAGQHPSLLGHWRPPGNPKDKRPRVPREQVPPCHPGSFSTLPRGTLHPWLT